VPDVKTRFRLVCAAFAATALGAVGTALATAQSADASNRCTRYVGSPGGIFNSGSCPGLTSWGTISLGAVLWSKTDGIAHRDENYIDPQPDVCYPDHIHLRYSNGSGNTASLGCVGAWIWGQGSGSTYAESWCGVHHSGDSGGIATYGQCYTKWTL
jgi:hypothetical protein